VARTRLKTDRLHNLYKIDQGGTYTIFRETVSKSSNADKPVTLVVGFRLKLLKSNPIMHRIFQRVCILTTPFWSGSPGFKVKLWMVDPKTKNYLGIYDWAGEQKALDYVTGLVRILRPLSTQDSVWYEIYPQQFEQYLLDHKIN
jgi:hypothetical protein